MLEPRARRRPARGPGPDQPRPASPIRFNLEIAIRCDFADIFEVKKRQIIRRGRITTEWSEAQQRLSHRLSQRAISCVPSASRTRERDSRAVFANGRISFEISLDPGAAWHCCLLYDLTDGERHFPAPLDCAHHARRSSHARCSRELAANRAAPAHHQRGVLPLLQPGAWTTWRRCACRSPGTEAAWCSPAAGLPWFMAPFGRDSLIASLQNHPGLSRLRPRRAGGAGPAGRRQERDDWRDAEPGKIMHELRYGELAHFKLIPHTPYYGTADATPLYLIVLHAAWRATGDRALLETAPADTPRPAWPGSTTRATATATGSRNSRHARRSATRTWPGRIPAIPSRNTDGSPGQGAEGVVRAARLCLRRLAAHGGGLSTRWRGRTARPRCAPRRRRCSANSTRSFWDEAGGFYAFMLDGEKRPVLTVASNPGHCLWSGIVPPERAGARRRAADGARHELRLGHPHAVGAASGVQSVFLPERLGLAARQQPDRAGLQALRLRRRGRADRPRHLRRGEPFRAATSCPSCMPASQRDGTTFPVQYLGANVPQAWAAGSAFTLLQAMLGIEPDAPRGVLYVDPALPDWLPDVTLYGSAARPRAISTSASGATVPRRASRCCAATRPRCGSAA